MPKHILRRNRLDVLSKVGDLCLISSILPRSSITQDRALCLVLLEWKTTSRASKVKELVQCKRSCGPAAP